MALKSTGAKNPIPPKYLPCLVNIVCECPQSLRGENIAFFILFTFILFTFQIPYAQSTTSIATDPSISDRGADRVCGRFMNIKKAQTSSQTLCSKY